MPARETPRPAALRAARSGRGGRAASQSGWASRRCSSTWAEGRSPAHPASVASGWLLHQLPFSARGALPRAHRWWSRPARGAKRLNLARERKRGAGGNYRWAPRRPTSSCGLLLSAGPARRAGPVAGVREEIHPAQAAAHPYAVFFVAENRTTPADLRSSIASRSPTKEGTSSPEGVGLGGRELQVLAPAPPSASLPCGRPGTTLRADAHEPVVLRLRRNAALRSPQGDEGEPEVGPAGRPRGGDRENEGTALTAGPGALRAPRGRRALLSYRERVRLGRTRRARDRAALFTDASLISRAPWAPSRARSPLRPATSLTLAAGCSSRSTPFARPPREATRSPR